MLLCLLFLGAHTNCSAEFPLTLPELLAGKSIRIYYRVNTNGTFSPVNATSISEQTTVTYSSGLQVSNDPATMMADDPTLTPAFAFDCTPILEARFTWIAVPHLAEMAQPGRLPSMIYKQDLVAELCPRLTPFWLQRYLLPFNI